MALKIRLRPQASIKVRAAIKLPTDLADVLENTNLAELSAAAAAASAAAAAASETAAETAETNADAAASAAASSASDASASASAASASASAAQTAETNAETAETNAETAEAAAEAAQAAAEAAQAAAEAALDSFDDTYLGSKASDPTLDNDGDALVEGQFYWNTSSDNLRFYDGAAWVAFTSGGDVAGDTNAAASKATPVDADELALVDSAASNVLKKLTWANLKATLKTYFDTLYRTITTSRELLTAARTYYVRTDGSDSNDGLANTSGGAFLTIQKAVDVAAGLDLGTYYVTIQVGAGTRTASVSLKTMVGSGTLIIVGDESTPSNVIQSTTSASCFTAAEGVIGKFSIRGFKLQTTTSGRCIDNLSPLAVIGFQACNFGACAADHIFAFNGAFVQASGNYTISGGAGQHMNALACGQIAVQNRTVTLTGTPAFTTFALCARNSVINANGNTYSGSATGVYYSAILNGVIYVAGGGGTYFPGNSAGSTATGGQYA